LTDGKESNGAANDNKEDAVAHGNAPKDQEAASGKAKDMSPKVKPATAKSCNCLEEAR
jgi:hypothetical protein